MQQTDSSVKYYNFSDEDKILKQQLLENELLEQFAVSRNQLARDPFRPHYHFTSPEGMLNDPNGLCYWNGKWHLFYQSYPPCDPRQHWGHAISSDLIHWKDLPYAIYPGPEKCCFSGNTIVEKNRVISMYHGFEAGNMVAVSQDKLLINWKKLNNSPVISNIDNNWWEPVEDLPGNYKVFDPCIWKHKGLYYSLSGGRKIDKPTNQPVCCFFLFKSSDLSNWEYMHQFLIGDRFTKIGDDGACPYLVKCSGKDALFFFSHMTGGQMFIGRYTNDMFEIETHHKFNFGAVTPGGVHAPSVCEHIDGTTRVIFNINTAISSTKWDHLMSIPRKISIGNHNEIYQMPVDEIKALRYKPFALENLKIPADKEHILDQIASNCTETYFELVHNDASVIELNFLQDPLKEEFTKISIYTNRGNPDRITYDETESIVSIDTSNSSLNPAVMSRPPESAPFKIGKDKLIKLRVFVDKSVLEVFVNDTCALSLRVYPSKANSQMVSIKSKGKSLIIKKLLQWKLKKINHDIRANNYIDSCL